MKLIIQIPCYNEENTLPDTVADLPVSIPGIDEIEYLIINDGSTDGTVAAAKRCGVHHIVSYSKNKGLAGAFMAGIDASLRLGADIIVNTDADNQYCGADIEKLIRPILSGRAEMVIGERPISEIDDFSPLKKFLQKLGSFVVRKVSGTDVPDAPSGFRAYTRESAMKLNVVSRYTYTLETIIQAGDKCVALESVQIRTNPKIRKSRLFKSMGGYIKRSVGTMFRIFLMYKPFKVFAAVGGFVFAIGVLLGIRFLAYYFSGGGMGHIQSLILAAILLIIGFQTFTIGLLADVISANRKLIEDVQYRVRRLDYKDGDNDL
ncbi:MAG: glycosyltransferase family 2 protein [Clostridia bacterium]|nr:glycosyltransferase family 2 protein [Clostridia bacterium]